MRIRRRPQAQAPIPDSPPHQASDPSTAAPPNQHHWLPRCKEEEDKPEELHPSYYPNADLGDAGEHSPATTRGAPLPWSHPQGDNVVGRSGGGGGAQRQGADGHGSLENGHRDEREWPAIGGAGAGGERLVVNGSVTPAMPTVPGLNVKEGIKISGDGGPKRRRGPAVLLEGSRCSRVNGRGWRCSQPTLVGYSLCEHHLGKGRQSRSGRSTASGVPKLGRTEPPASGRKNAVVVAAAPDAATEPAPHLIEQS